MCHQRVMKKIIFLTIFLVFSTKEIFADVDYTQFLIKEKKGAGNFTYNFYVKEWNNYVTDIYEVDTGGSWYIDFNQFETYETSTNLQIFEEGRKIYDKVRDPDFQWGSDDDWEGNIQWLLMKSPY